MSTERQLMLARVNASATTACVASLLAACVARSTAEDEIEYANLQEACLDYVDYSVLCLKVTAEESDAMWEAGYRESEFDNCINRSPEHGFAEPYCYERYFAWVACLASQSDQAIRDLCGDDPQGEDPCTADHDVWSSDPACG
jgi:hypothetical protein